MKKNDIKKLRLSKETLRSLKSTDVQAVVGGIAISFESSCETWVWGPCGCGQSHSCTGGC